MAATNSGEVVIVGGGIIGCLTAYFLSVRGVRPVVVEADAIASGASGTSGGWLTPYSHDCDPAMIALSPVTLALHRELAEALPEETGIDHGFEETPYLRCALTEDGAADLLEWHTARTYEGAVMDWLAPAEAKALTPWLTADLVGAIRSDNEPTLDSYRLTVSAMQAAEKHGARVVTGKVVGLATEGVGSAGRRSSGVRLEDGTEVLGDAVLLAMGPWTGQASEWIGAPLPITPQRGQMVYLAAPSDGDGPDLEVGLSAVDTGGSILSKRLTDTIVAATREDVGFDRSTTSAARDWLLKRAATLSDRVMGAGISGQTACLRPLTPDGKPYVGAAPGWENVHIAAGHASEGIHYGPVTAMAMADLIINGTSDIDVSALDPGRASSG
ncbi:MAG: FAD-binding oxidoreductase [Chloroflexi bacterium]|nr:FAD-binding oxidoreductase [Chloroflexota bacterium]